jgi:hypothetical protein
VSFVVETILEFAADLFSLESNGRIFNRKKRKLQKVISKLKKEQQWFDEFYSTFKYQFIIHNNDQIIERLLNPDYIRTLELSEFERQAFKELVQRAYDNR